MEHHCPVEDTHVDWDTLMLVLVLYSIHSPDVLHSILLPIHPAKYQGIRDNEHNELTLIYICSFIYLLIALYFFLVREQLAELYV